MKNQTKREPNQEIKTPNFIATVAINNTDYFYRIHNKYDEFICRINDAEILFTDNSFLTKHLHEFNKLTNECLCELLLSKHL